MDQYVLFALLGLGTGALVAGIAVIASIIVLVARHRRPALMEAA